MKVLITGGHGQVGYCLTEQLKNKADILSVDRDVLDITDEVAVNKIVNDFLPDIIINAAAHTAVDKAEEEKELSYKINHEGPLFLAKAAQKVGAAILHISTDYVFAGDKIGSYKETDVTDPQGVYGASKRSGEVAVSQACKRHIILRTAWVFGEHGHNFVKTMVRLSCDRDKLSIVSDQYGGPTFAGDIAATLIKIAEQIEMKKDVNWGTYHFSGLPHVSWYEFAEVIFHEAESQGVIDKAPKLKAITTAEYPTPAKRPANSKLNCSKIESEFGIKSSDWKRALSRIKNYS